MEICRVSQDEIKHDLASGFNQGNYESKPDVTLEQVIEAVKQNGNLTEVFSEAEGVDAVVGNYQDHMTRTLDLIESADYEALGRQLATQICVYLADSAQDRLEQMGSCKSDYSDVQEEMRRMHR